MTLELFRIAVPLFAGAIDSAPAPPSTARTCAGNALDRGGHDNSGQRPAGGSESRAAEILLDENHPHRFLRDDFISFHFTSSIGDRRASGCEAAEHAEIHIFLVSDLRVLAARTCAVAEARGESRENKKAIRRRKFMESGAKTAASSACV